MAREIKFRAWIPSHEEMHMLETTGIQKFDCENGFSAMFTADGYAEIWAHENYGVVKDAILMQYTGLKDKNGTEIYEGDVIKAVRYRIEAIQVTEVVAFRKGCFCTQCNCDVTVDISYHQEKDIEIIGNIYENPELIK